MNFHDRRMLAIALLMFGAAGAASGLRPTQKVADSRPRVDLESVVPMRFGAWSVDNRVVPVTVSPDVLAQLNRIYNQVLNRTYVNQRGQTIMLSIAYGADQSDNLQIHLPEGCYLGQGFSVAEKSAASLQTPFGPMRVAHLVASKGPRIEPITYWIVVGGQVALTGWEEKKSKLAYAIRRQIPDGALVRISSITPEPQAGYALHQDFANALMQELGMEGRRILVGRAPAAG